MSEEEDFAQFEKLGEARVRDLANGGWGKAERAYKWLKLRQEQRELEEKQARAAERELAESALRRSNIANAIAVGAAIIALLSWLLPAISLDFTPALDGERAGRRSTPGPSQPRRDRVGASHNSDDLLIGARFRLLKLS